MYYLMFLHKGFISLIPGEITASTKRTTRKTIISSDNFVYWRMLAKADILLTNCNVHRHVAVRYIWCRFPIYSKNRREGKVSLPFDWDFLQDNLPSEKLAGLRRRFMEEWRSGEYTRKEMIERYLISERTFWYTI